jgi:hypothetical protein
MFAIVIIAGLTAVNQLLSLVSDWHTERKEKHLSFSEFITSEKLKLVSFFLALIVTLISGFLSYDSEKSTDSIIGNIDATKMEIDTVKVLADSMQQLQRELNLNQKKLVDAYEEINELQAERHNEIMGGNSAPTLRLESRLYPLSFIQYNENGTVKRDSLALHVLLTFYFINESPYTLKSARVTIDHLDYLNQKRFLNGTYMKDPGPWGIMKFNNSHEVHEFNTLPPDPNGKISKRFTILVPLEGYDLYQFFLSVEWSNGYYSGELEIRPDKNFNSKLYFKNASDYAKIFKLVTTKAKFKTLSGRKKPKYIFIHEPNTPFISGELRNE